MGLTPEEPASASGIKQPSTKIQSFVSTNSWMAAGLAPTETPVLPQRNTIYTPRHRQPPASHPYKNPPMQLSTVVTPTCVPKCCLVPSKIPISTSLLSLTQASIYSWILNLKSRSLGGCLLRDLMNRGLNGTTLRSLPNLWKQWNPTSTHPAHLP